MKIETDFNMTRWIFGYWRLGVYSSGRRKHAVYIGPLALCLTVGGTRDE